MPTSRRQFARTLAVAGAVVPLATSDLLAQTPPIQTPAAPPPTGTKIAEEQPAEKPVSALGRAMTEIVRAQHGQHLTPEELEKIGDDFQDWAPYIERFRTFELKNADEPDWTFQPLTERW